MMPEYKPLKKNLFKFYLSDDFEEKHDYVEQYSGQLSIGTIGKYKIICPASFGHSIGVALRRNIISNANGCGIVAYKISGCESPYSNCIGVNKNAFEIANIINTLQCEINDENKDSVVSTIEVKKDSNPKIITAGMFENDNLTIYNKDLEICSVIQTNFSLSILVTRGFGYVEEKENRNRLSVELGWFATPNTIFSPVISVTYNCITLEDTDELTLSITTCNKASTLPIIHDAMNELEIVFSGSNIIEEDESEEENYASILKLSITEWAGGLVPKVSATLSNNGVQYVEDILMHSPQELKSIMTGIGDKYIDDIKNIFFVHAGGSEIYELILANEPEENIRTAICRKLGVSSYSNIINLDKMISNFKEYCIPSKKSDTKNTKKNTTSKFTKNKENDDV